MKSGHLEQVLGGSGTSLTFFSFGDPNFDLRSPWAEVRKSTACRMGSAIRHRAKECVAHIRRVLPGERDEGVQMELCMALERLANWPETLPEITGTLPSLCWLAESGNEGVAYCAKRAIRSIGYLAESALVRE